MRTRNRLYGFTNEQLIDSLAYLGYATTGWDHRVRSFILGKNSGNYLINLNYTITFIKIAVSFFFDLCLKKAVCVLINENIHFRTQLDMAFNNRTKKFQWLHVISSKLKRGALNNRKIRKKTFKVFPNVVFVSSPSHSSFFLLECRLLGIPTISINDTNLLHTTSDYIIPSSEKSPEIAILFNVIFYLYFTKAFLTRSSVFLHKVNAFSNTFLQK